MKRVKTEKRRKCRKEEKPEIGGNKRGADKERKGRKVERRKDAPQLDIVTNNLQFFSWFPGFRR